MAVLKQLSNILVGIDQSDNSYRVLEYAVDMAKATRAKLVVVHAVENSPATYGGLDSEDIKNELYEKGKKFLDETVKEVSNGQSIKIDAVLKQGRASDAIVDTAKTVGADIIIVGSRGMGGLREMVLGSTSHTVANRSPIPVLIVK